jgi:hypothetical protein
MLCPALRYDQVFVWRDCGKLREICQNSMSPGRYLNSGSPRYDTRMLTMRPIRLVPQSAWLANKEQAAGKTTTLKLRGNLVRSY